jgi:hypothetical protein
MVAKLPVIGWPGARLVGAGGRGEKGDLEKKLTGDGDAEERAESEGAAGGAGGRLGADTGGGATGVDSRRGLAMELQLRLVDLFAATACPRRVPRRRTGTPAVRGLVRRCSSGGVQGGG